MFEFDDYLFESGKTKAINTVKKTLTSGLNAGKRVAKKYGTKGLTKAGKVAKDNKNLIGAAAGGAVAAKMASGSKNQSADMFLQQIQLDELYQEEAKKEKRKSYAKKGAAIGAGAALGHSLAKKGKITKSSMVKAGAGALAGAVAGKMVRKNKKTNQSLLFESMDTDVNFRKMEMYAVNHFNDGNLWYKFCLLKKPQNNISFIELLIDWTEFLCIDYLKSTHKMIDVDVEDFIQENYSLELYLRIIKKAVTPNTITKAFSY